MVGRDEATSILRDCEELDVKLSIDRGGIVARGWLNDSMRARIREHRNDILEILRREAAVMPDIAESAGETGPPKPESARVYIPSLDSELWIASDPAEAARLGPELGAEGDERPIILAGDVAKLASLPTEGLVAAVRTLVAFPGVRVASAEPLPDLPEGATGAVYFEFSDGVLTRENLFSADAAEPESAEPLFVAAEPVQWSGNADELTAWFARALAEAHLPTEAFHLEPGRRIADPAKWYATLCRDIGAGARGPRAGALVDELRRLREIVETK